jgi:hypothetical protein
MNLYHITSADHLTTMIHERQGIAMVMLEFMSLSLPLHHLKASLKAPLLATSLEVMALSLPLHHLKGLF